MMGPDPSSPIDRARASLFGAAAERYDQYRPACPSALADDLALLGAKSALDVGCGTGQVARTLIDRGIAVLGVEIDERMADVARRHGVDVEVGAFETWNPQGRQFDLLTSADAWGWIDPEAGMAKAAESLRLGGTIACFWTTRVLSEDVSAALATVYAEHAPEVSRVWDPAVNVPRAHASRAAYFELNQAFGPVELRSYELRHVYSAEDWIGLASTISDHIRLGEQRLEALLRAVGTQITDVGGEVVAHEETYALLAHRS